MQLIILWTLAHSLCVFAQCLTVGRLGRSLLAAQLQRGFIGVFPPGGWDFDPQVRGAQPGRGDQGERRRRAESQATLGLVSRVSAKSKREKNRFEVVLERTSFRKRETMAETEITR